MTCVGGCCMPVPNAVAEKKLRLKTNQGQALQACTILAAEYAGGEWRLLVLSCGRLHDLKRSEIGEAEEV